MRASFAIRIKPLRVPGKAGISHVHHLHDPLATVKMRLLLLLSVGVLAPSLGLAAPSRDLSSSGLATRDEALYKRENVCSLKAPPALCQTNTSVTVEETALRAYKFYRAFVVDGDPKTMFSLIDSTYKVSCLPGRNPSLRSR